MMRLFDGLALSWSLVACGFTLVALARLLGSHRRPAPPPQAAPWPPVLLLRPVDEPTPHERSLWGSPIDYPGPLAHVVVSPLRGRLPSGVHWLRSTPASPNRKVGHLAYALARLKDPRRVVLCVDADVEVDGALVRALVTAISHGAALAAAPPEPTVARGLPAALWRGLLVHSHHSFALLGLMGAGAPALCGKAIALGAMAQAELGTLGELAGEDLALADRLHRRGERVVTVGTSALCPLAPELTLATVAERAKRWARVLLAHRPLRAATVPLLMAPTPLVCLWAAARPSPAHLAAMLGLLLSRSTLAAWLGARARRRQAGGWLAWAPAELLWLVAFGRALAGGPLAWRGRTYRLALGGRLLPTGVEAR